MSVQRQSIPPKDPDLEITAELPVLDVAAYETAITEDRTGSTDTWHMPTLNAQAAQAATAAAAVAGSAGTVGAAEDRSLRLETDLRALSGNLRDVEERLTRKGERLIELERELANARAERVAVDERAASLVSEAQARAANAIRESEERAAALVTAAEERAAAVAAQLSAARSELSTEQARATSLQVSVEERDLAARTLQSHDQQLLTQLAARERELALARGDLRALETRTAHHLESLQTLEGRRNIFDEQLLGLADELQARDAQVAQLQQELATQNARAQELATDLAAGRKRIEALESAGAQTVQARTALDEQRAANQLRIEELERDLAISRAESAERATGMLRLEAERDDQVNRFAASEARAVELERRIDDNAEVIRQLQEDLRAMLTRGTELEGDLRAAEDAINRLEGELRTRSAKLDELTRTHEEWRSTVETARHSLAERESLIHRLETEAANSAVLLGNIQQSINRFDTSQSGSHDVAPEGAVRLLIRVDGDSEVVHVLGRKTTVGRTPDNDLQIDAKFISRNHAVILAGPNHTIIEDLNSTNGVAVNGKRITRHTLRDGDNLSIGKTSFRFSVRPMREARQ